MLRIGGPLGLGLFNGVSRVRVMVDGPIWDAGSAVVVAGVGVVGEVVSVTSSQPSSSSSSVVSLLVSVDFGLSVELGVIVMSTQVVTGDVMQTTVTEGSPSELSSSRRLMFA